MAKSEKLMIEGEKLMIEGEKLMIEGEKLMMPIHRILLVNIDYSQIFQQQKCHIFIINFSKGEKLMI